MLFILFVISTLLVHMFAASPAVDNQSRAQIVRYDFDTSNMPNSYRYNYDATDGSSRNEQGAILQPGTKDAALDVAGAVRWYNDKGHLYEMTYKAGKRGYRTIIKRLS
ncbi:flexible cuticle protein 12-like [Anticarsia gemmatalis]|uniref:flexible cuticle protein 12-like n=1 Tax=Anticarsia gemmatalis TaxID=129554 RepID=UPI003F76D033